MILFKFRGAGFAFAAFHAEKQRGLGCLPHWGRWQRRSQRGLTDRRAPISSVSDLSELSSVSDHFQLSLSIYTTFLVSAIKTAAIARTAVRQIDTMLSTRGALLETVTVSVASLTLTVFSQQSEHFFLFFMVFPFEGQTKFQKRSAKFLRTALSFSSLSGEMTLSFLIASMISE